MKLYLTLAQAAKTIPTTSGSHPSIMTLWRWCTVGVKGVKLPHLRFGRRIVVTPEALERFAVELAQVWAESTEESTAKPTTPHKPKARAEAQREHAIAAAEERLRRGGYMSDAK